MQKFVSIEGIDYVGKTTLAQALVKSGIGAPAPRVAKQYTDKERLIHSDPNHFSRFSFFLEEVVARSSEITSMLKRANVVADRYAESIYAYHNVLLQRRLDEQFILKNLLSPDIRILLTVNEQTLHERMRLRPPRHRYESDSKFLLLVQNEFIRLVGGHSTIVIDTSHRKPAETILTVSTALFNRGLRPLCG